ncbi:hypothetical protein [Methanolobus halotolerans]|uniref:Uncharacterized protein n=1 Tax=Methanolobus halotolerans TaxID=2052935 RepID=A0A4E0QQA7_9EURY|nr:hypothetical protein [Methanolobus halotolerans]TGC07311.1 hypothetical protein CUN85_11700 [Methanolobus halotolerans]
MSLIEKIFGKKQKETETGPLRLEFNKLPDLISAQYRKNRDVSAPVIEKKYKEIGSSVRDIKDARKELLDAEAIADANKRAEKLGDSNRENVAHNLNLIIEKIRVPSNKDPKNALVFFEDSKATMKNVLDNTRKSQLYIKALYPTEFENINLRLANLESLLDELYEMIRDDKNKIDAFEKLPQHMENISQKEKEAQLSRKRILALEEKYESAKTDLVNAGSDIAKLRNSSEFQKANDLENNIKALENKIYAVNSDIRRLFTPMSKALSRMEKQDKNEMHVLSPENRKVLIMLKDDPASIPEKELGPFLDMLEKRIQSRDLGLKDPMYEKILRQIHKLKETTAMSDLREQSKMYSSDIETLTAELSRLDIYREMDLLQTQESQYRDSIGLILSNMEAEHKHLEEIEEHLEISRSILNSEVKEIFGQDAEIVY